MRKFKIEVWYRFVCFGEIEKDFEIHNIIASSSDEAMKLARSLYVSKSKIPFQINLIKN